MKQKEYKIIINGVQSAVKDVTKLSTVLEELDKVAKNGVKVSATVTASTKEKTKALTEEEKAEKKLAETKAKLARADSEANKEQVKANLQLQEKNREIKRQVALNDLAEGSVRALGMTLTDLRNEWESLSEEERINAEVGGKLLTQIQELDKKYKHLRESTGNFRDSVGNYEKALGQIGKLNQGLSQLGSTANGLTSSFNGSAGSMQVFGFMALSAEKANEELNKVMLLTTLLMQLNNALTKEGIIATAGRVAMDKIATTQLKAKTVAEAMATKGTVLATIAQAAFNLVAYANPYVLLAMALVALVSALAFFISSTDDASDSQKKLNEQESIWLEYLDAEAGKIKLVTDSRVGMYERELKLLKAKGASLEETRAIEDKILREKQIANAKMRGLYHEEVTAIEDNRDKLAQYLEVLRMVKMAQARGDSKMLVDIDLNGKAKSVKVEEALDIVQGKVDNLNRKIEIGVKLKTEEATLANDLEVEKATRAKFDKEEADRKAKEGAQKAKEARDRAREIARAEVDETRKAEDLKTQLLGQSLEAQRTLIRKEYDRQAEDLKTKLKEDDKLNANAKKAITDQIITLEKLKAQKLEELNKAISEKELADQRTRQDAETALIAGAMERRRAEINFAYDRQVEDLNTRLATEKGLTEKQQKEINATIVALNKQKGVELEKVTVEDAKKRISAEMTASETALKAGLKSLGDIIKRDKITGVLDAEATKKNLKDANKYYSEYVDSVKAFQIELRKTHDDTVKDMDVNSVEYAEAVNQYVNANLDAVEKIKGAQKAMQDNNKAHREADSEMWAGMAGEVAKYATLVADAVSAVVDTLNAGLQAQIDGLTEKLEEVNKHYEEAKTKREEYTQNVVDLEDKLKTASGGTAEAYKQQLQDAMHLRDESAREEQRLQREKEKREAEIAKKEKQIRRNDMIAKIAQGVANTAQAVTSMLATVMYPLNFVMAGIVGTMGAVQTGIMGAQLAKMADGGEVFGATHANGGIKVGGGMEWEGNEFLINRRSYAQNKGLVNLINNSDEPLSIAQMLPFASFGDLPADTVQGDETSEIVEAIEGINLRPVVSVTDINDVNDDLTTVKDLSDF